MKILPHFTLPLVIKHVIYMPKDTNERKQRSRYAILPNKLLPVTCSWCCIANKMVTKMYTTTPEYPHHRYLTLSKHSHCCVDWSLTTLKIKHPCGMVMTYNSK
jgi:hypothetical protein